MKIQYSIWGKPVLSIVACASAVILLGCPPRRQMTLCNNSGEDHLVLGINKWAEWKDRGAIRIGADGDLDWTDLSTIVDQRAKVQFRLLIVYTCGRRIPYPLKFRPADDRIFLDRSTGLYRSSFQIEPDQKLYAVRAGEKCPAGEIPQQPEGYPMEADLKHQY